MSIEALTRCDQEQVWIVVNDLKSLLVKFCKQENLSKESKGGSYEHNAKVIGFYLQTIIFMLEKSDNNSKNDQYLKAMDRILESGVSNDKNLNFEHFYLLMTLNLVLLPPVAWRKKYKQLFWRLLLNLVKNARDEDPDKKLRKKPIVKNNLTLKSNYQNIIE
jgi:hypothetical protein